MFSNIDNEEKAYWLGFLAADGCITTHKSGCKYIKLSLSHKDKEHLEKFKKFMKSNNKISEYLVGSSATKEKKYKCCEIKIGSNKIAAELAVYGIVPKKTHNVTIPDIPEELVKHYIRGVWDGDGTVLYRAGRPKYPDNIYPSVQLCGNKEMLEAVQKVFEEELNITPSKLSPVSSIFLFRKDTRNAKRIIDYLYSDCSVYLDRKYKTYQEAKNWKPKYNRRK